MQALKIHRSSRPSRVSNALTATLMALAGAVASARAGTTYIWNVAMPAVNYWNVSGNWTPANYPGFGGSTNDTATFGSVGTQSSETVDNQLSANTVLGATNVAVPFSQWTPILTNTFNASGVLNLSTNIVNPALPAEYFQIVNE